MSIEYFTNQIGSFPIEPAANIFKKRIYINTPAQKKFPLKPKKQVLLGFDRDEQQICLKIIDSPQPGSRSIFNGNISCKYFLDYFQIYQPQKNLEIIWSDDSPEIIIIQLKEADAKKLERK